LTLSKVCSLLARVLGVVVELDDKISDGRVSVLKRLKNFEVRAHNYSLRAHFTVHEKSFKVGIKIALLTMVPKIGQNRIVFLVCLILRHTIGLVRPQAPPDFIFERKRYPNSRSFPLFSVKIDVRSFVYKILGLGLAVPLKKSAPSEPHGQF
jgi:hypothetical protein